MNRLLIWIWLLVLLVAGTASGQSAYNPYAPPPQQNLDPRTRRALREQAVAYAGPNARQFVEQEGDMAVNAIAACSPDGARRLVEFYNSGDLGRLPKPADFLYAVSLRGNGEDVLYFAIQHAKELTDLDTFLAYLENPLEYACGLRQLEQGAAEMRARRLGAKANATSAPGYGTDWKSIAYGAAGMGGCVLLYWWWRARRQAAL